MIKRRLQDRVRELLDRTPAVALMGPRQVGKTTLALEITAHHSSTYLDLEDMRDLAKISDVYQFHAANADKLIILDEIQRLPEVFTQLRGIIDAQRRAGRKAGQFLLLGSASIDLLRQSSESLAGRIAYAELFPLDALEISKGHAGDEITRLWLRGGFPESYLAANDSDSREWRFNFIRTYLERDIPLLGPRIPAETLRRFWTMLAHLQGSTLNAANLARNLGISGQTVVRYLDLLVDLLLVRRVQPWTRNTGKRIVRSPKVYVRDSGITHALLGIESMNDLLGHPVIGGSWEGFVIENLLTAAPAHTEHSFYRTATGNEIDLVLELRSGDICAIEIKRSSAPALSEGFYRACEDIGATQKYVVYPGEETFPLGKNVQAIALTELMEKLSPHR